MKQKCQALCCDMRCNSLKCVVDITNENVWMFTLLYIISAFVNSRGFCTEVTFSFCMFESPSESAVPCIIYCLGRIWPHVFIECPLSIIEYILNFVACTRARTRTHTRTHTHTEHDYPVEELYIIFYIFLLALLALFFCTNLNPYLHFLFWVSITNWSMRTVHFTKIFWWGEDIVSPWS
jgi:hypothetical protein